MIHRRMSAGQRLRLIIAAVLCCLAVIGLCTAMALGGFTAGAPVTVSDWDQTYELSVSGWRDLDTVLAQAQREGMAPLGRMDCAEWEQEGRSVTVRRGVEMFVKDGEETTEYVAYKGDTVGQALEENGFRLKDTDQVTPSREMAIAAALTVEIKRLCRVNITADGETVQVQMTEGTVADALELADIKLGEHDTCSHELEEPVKDDMHVQISRVMRIKVTADGRTRTYKVSALDVAGALDKCGIVIGDEDRVSPSLDAPLTGEMRITVRRVETKEETEIEEIDYETKYIHTRDLTEGQTSVLTAGMKGKKEKTYKSVYVDGKLESQELLSEKVTAEPVKEIIMRGNGYQTKAPQLEFIDDGSGNASSGDTDLGGDPQPGISVSASAGTLIDDKGKTVSYKQAITGTCTAYCIPGGTTSIGLLAERGVIAVDPDIIPYGTKMFVASPDGKIVYGYGVAGDTGGACMAGDIIADLCYDTIEECSIIGRRDMVLYILE